MKLIAELKEFFAVDKKLKVEQERCLFLQEGMNEQLKNLKRISKTLSGEYSEAELKENEANWLVIKKNNFLEDIETIFNTEKKEK